MYKGTFALGGIVLWLCSAVGVGQSFQVSSQGKPRNFVGGGPAAAFNAEDEEFLIVFGSLGFAPDVLDLKGRRVTPAGTLLGREFLVSTPATDVSVGESALAFSPVDRIYLAAWEEISDAGLSIRGRLLDVNGKPLTGVLEVSPPSAGTSDARRPELVFDPFQRHFFVVWEEDMGAQGRLRARRVREDGTMGELIVPVADGPGISRREPTVAFDPFTGKAYLAWIEERVEPRIRLARLNRHFRAVKRPLVVSQAPSGAELAGLDLGVDEVCGLALATWRQIDAGGDRIEAAWSSGQGPVNQLSVVADARKATSAFLFDPFINPFGGGPDALATGLFLIFWETLSGEVQAAFLGPGSGKGVSASMTLSMDPSGDPAVAAAGGRALAVWVKHPPAMPSGLVQATIVGSPPAPAPPMPPFVMTSFALAEVTPANPVPAGSPLDMLRFGVLHLNDTEPPAIRLLAADRGEVADDQLLAGGALIETDFSLDFLVAGSEVTAASGTIRHQALGSRGSRAFLRGSLTRLDVKPMAVSDLAALGCDLDFPELGATMTLSHVRGRVGGGFELVEAAAEPMLFDIGMACAMFSPHVDFADVFMNGFLTAPDFGSALRTASSVLSFNTRVNSRDGRKFPLDGEEPPKMTIDPDPVPVCPIPGLAMDDQKAMLTWAAPGSLQVEVRTGDRNGPRVSPDPPKEEGKEPEPKATLLVSSASGGILIPDGTIFVLVDIGSRDVLATARLRHRDDGCKAGTLTLIPQPLMVCNPAGLGRLTVQWDSPIARAVEIRLNGPEGTLFVRGGPSGSARTGLWVRNGLRFFLLDADTREVLDQATAIVNDQGCPSLTASPNPVMCPGTTNLTVMNVPGSFEVRQGRPSGPVVDPLAGVMINVDTAFFLVDPATGQVLDQIIVHCGP